MDESTSLTEKDFCGEFVEFKNNDQTLHWVKRY